MSGEDIKSQIEIAFRGTASVEKCLLDDDKQCAACLSS